MLITQCSFWENDSATVIDLVVNGSLDFDAEQKNSSKIFISNFIQTICRSVWNFDGNYKNIPFVTWMCRVTYCFYRQYVVLFEILVGIIKIFLCYLNVLRYLLFLQTICRSIWNSGGNYKSIPVLLGGVVLLFLQSVFQFVIFTGIIVT